jgi:hypothetical protein
VVCVANRLTNCLSIDRHADSAAPQAIPHTRIGARDHELDVSDGTKGHDY